LRTGVGTIGKLFSFSIITTGGIRTFSISGSDSGSGSGSPQAQNISPSSCSAFSLILQCWLKSKLATRPLNALSRLWAESRLFTIGVDVAVAVTNDTSETGGAESARSGGNAIFGVVSPVMVETELPDGDETLKPG
jgi:hypothetical protein